MNTETPPDNSITIPKIDLNTRIKEEQWNQIKKTRAQITLYSMKKSMERVITQKHLQSIDNIQAEDDFNIALTKQIHYEKSATEYGDANSITKGVFSKNGEIYITVGSSGEGKIWNTLNPNQPDFCTEISSLKSNAKICGVDLNPRVGTIPASAPNIVTGTTNGQLHVWTLSKQIKQQKCITKEAHSQRINSIKFMQTGNYFLTSSYDKSWMLWDAKRLNKIFTQKGHQKQIHTSSVHPDQSLFLTGDIGGFAMVWDLRTGKGVFQAKQNDSILCCDFNPNGFQFAVSGKTNIISIFDLRRKKQLKKIPAHLKLISDLKYDQHSYYLASVSHDNSIRLWHGQNYSLLPTEDLTEQHKITSIDLKNGRMAVTGIDRKWSMFVNKFKWRGQNVKMEVQ